MKRGDIVIVAAPGDFGKPRPAVVVQSDFFNGTHSSIVVCQLTTDIVDAPLFRITVEPTRGNGVRQTSQIMIDKIVALRRDRIDRRAGTLDADTLLRVSRSLAFWLGLGD